MSNNSSSKPTISYWHVWTDHNGVSHQSRCQIEDFIQKGIAPDTSPQWLSRLKQSGATITFTALPVEWVGNWYENPRPQWIITLSGCWFVKTMDGHQVEMGAGEISFGEDQGTKADAQGRKGHLSGTVGDVPAVLILVQFEQTPSVGQACQFK